MDKQFGLHYLLKTYLGISSNEVRPPQREERKSIGSERCVKIPSGIHTSVVLIRSRTFSPLDDGEVLLQKLEHIASELETDMARNGWAGKTITLKYKLDTYQGEILSVTWRLGSTSFYVISFQYSPVPNHWIVMFPPRRTFSR